jgi:hypothetical protein
MPNTSTGAGESSSSGAACSRRASITVGQDSPSCRAEATTVAQVPSLTRSPASARNRVVIRARAGRTGSDSVNEARSHNRSRQYQRRLTHTRSSPLLPYGRSRGRVHTTSFTWQENTPQVGQARAVSSAVTTRTTRPPSGVRSTASTASPSRSSNSVAAPAAAVSLCTPATSFGVVIV